ncbi:unnamed protein product [Trichogramma brassicae]|uniref:Transcription factor IIIC subunit Tfc1/Sfc1 triple barrel domain-containing protein n=1 Tax=Trichogramma brassicae TaxID=86971 RepID=A0A6H5III3_9HYME|nr:unnamed protein product [Trichogramma brassicae]
MEFCPLQRCISTGSIISRLSLTLSHRSNSYGKKMSSMKTIRTIQTVRILIEITNSLVQSYLTVGIKNRRMELRFRPDDGYCKPACGDRQQTNGFLLRIRIKKSRRHKVEEDEERTEKQNSTSDASHSHSNKSTKSKNLSINKLTNYIANCSVESNNAEKNKNENDNNIPPTFDRNKYENLASDVEYELPKLKVLGRVDTEFRFTNPTSLPRKRKTGPTGKIRKKKIKKPRKKQTVVSNVEHQPSAMMLIDENDIRSEEEDEGEWEDANEDAEAGPSSLEPNETDATQS